MAFNWLQRHIGGFGGDPQRVTAAGVSAGSSKITSAMKWGQDARRLIRDKRTVSILLHLAQTKPLFSQAVCMGGTPALIPRLPNEVAESTYASVLEKLGIADDAPEERIRRLIETGRQDWVAKLGPGLALSPVASRDEKKAPFYQIGVPDQDTSPPGSDWCPRIMLGDCEMDVSLAFGRNISTCLSSYFCGG